MAWVTSLGFQAQHEYEESPAGILIPIALIHGTRQVELNARLDTGAADCIFDSQYADALSLDLESGYPRQFRTVMGSFMAFGHVLTIRTFSLEWDAMAFFHSTGNPAHAFLGRRGWLDRVQLGLRHYDQRLYLAGMDVEG